MSTTDQYLVLELLGEGQGATVRAVCSSLSDAAELIANRKISEVQNIIDSYNSSHGLSSYNQNLFVIKAPQNTYLDVTNEPRVNIVENDLSDHTKALLRAVMKLYNELHSSVMKSSTVELNHLNVNPNTYERDRKAREYELMQRMHVRPLWRGNVTGGDNSGKRVNVVPTATGNIPQPAANISVQHDNVNANPIFQGTPTPSTSAPVQLPGLVPVASETPNPITTSVPLAPVVTGGALRNMVTNSIGQTFEAPPANTATATTSRVTGI